MGYHKNKIEKGIVGEFSKVREEIQELLDADEQKDNVLIICELTDLIGAIESFIQNKYKLELIDLIEFSRKTKQAFIEGKRK